MNNQYNFNKKGFYSKKLIFELIKSNIKKPSKEEIKKLYLLKYNSENVPLCIDEEIESVLTFKTFKQYKEVTEREITKHIPLYRGFNRIKTWYGTYKS